MKKFIILLLWFLLKGVELKFFNDESDSILRDLINYNSVKVKQNHDKVHDYYPETVYYSPFQAMARNENFTKTFEKLGNAISLKLNKRSADTTFRGKPKTIQVKRT